MLVGVKMGTQGNGLRLCLGRGSGHKLSIVELEYLDNGSRRVLREGMPHQEIVPLLPPPFRSMFGRHLSPRLKVVRDRCFLVIGVSEARGGGILPAGFFAPAIRQVIHLPGLRGNPERNYPVSAAKDLFPGTFEKYTASVILEWQRVHSQKLASLNQDLLSLRLTWKAEARLLNEAEAELRVGRMARSRRGGARDLVNIADVGFGLSQVLPVLVALQAAEPRQLVYLEQPEIHLHPAAQLGLAEVLAKAAQRGVRVVLETHSALLLLRVQALVAEGRLASEEVKLHWFRRSADGSTEIASADLDENGAFGDWPEDFGPTELAAQSQYLDAVEARKAR
jgi:hypothetical protein